MCNVLRWRLLGRLIDFNWSCFGDRHLLLLVIVRNYHDDELDYKDFDDDGCIQRAFPQYGKW